MAQPKEKSMIPHKHADPNAILEGLPAEVRRRFRQWSRATDRDPEVRRSNFHTQLKVLGIHLIFLAALAAYLATAGHWLVWLVSVAALGLFALPVLRLHMHIQGHWKFGNGPVRNWLLDRCVSLLFGISQTGYKYGHLAHHRYDNDFDARGFPRDLQSTYIFSRNGRASNIWLWCAFYLVVYQHAIHLFHVVNAPRRRELLWYAFEYALIAGLHVALYSVAAGFYLGVYLPALGLAWMVAAVSLYMMHAVDLDKFQLHPTLNSHSWLFNWVGNNDGYHLEHSLYPNLHPAFLDRASALIGPPREQVLEGTYVTEALRRIFLGQRSQPAAAAPREEARQAG
jgi:fatty acid desaturase